MFALLPGDLFEVIVVDGGSLDGTVEVAQALRPDVKVVRQHGAGRGRALASGLAAVRGDIVVTLEGDGSTDPREIGPRPGCRCRRRRHRQPPCSPWQQ